MFYATRSFYSGETIITDRITNCNHRRWRWVWALLVLITTIWFLSIDGQVIITLDRGVGFPHPQIQLQPSSPQPGEIVTVWVTDLEPWAHVLLTINGVSAQLEESNQNGDLSWTWVWTFTAPKVETYPITFLNDCHTGCRLRGQVEVGAGQPDYDFNLIPTKLGVVFPSPSREWHGRRGWGVDLTYATLANEPPWGIDHLATRVAQQQVKGVQMLVRVDYAPGQSIPPRDDHVALEQYLAYSARLARDERLQGVYGYIIGSGYNAFGSNQHDLERAVTPAWYARVFNGYGEGTTQRDNVVQVMRGGNPRARILVGPVQPWNLDQSGPQHYKLNMPWLTYFNTLIFYIEQSEQAKGSADISLAGPDGFAVQAPGNPAAPELGHQSAAREPNLDLGRASWQGAQVGFGVYRDWLAVINSYPSTQNLPVFISATNTFVPGDEITPAQNYPSGWLTTALDTVNQTPQIKSLIWFMDDLGHDTQWEAFSLTQQVGRLADAADEFDLLLQRREHE